MAVNLPPISTLLSEIQAKMPVFSTRKALVVVNMQNDAFELHNNTVLCEQQEFRDPLRRVIPYFRRLGDIVWVKSELDITPVAPITTIKQEMSPGRTQDTSSRSSPASNDSSPGHLDGDVSAHYFPNSRKKPMLQRSFSEHRSDPRRLESEAWDMDDDPEAYLKKPRKGGSPDALFIPGTRGVELIPEMSACMDSRNDLVLTKRHYSAFDSTSLLVSLRTKFVTHIFIAGCLSNVSVYATAADAVKHGFEVTVVEDCLGYRSPKKHLEAMRKMADLLGVSGIDSGELIEEAGGPQRVASGFRTSPNLGTSDQTPKQGSVRDSVSPGKLSEASLATTVIESVPIRNTPPSTSQSDAVPMEGVETISSPAKTGKVVLGPGDKVGEGDSSIVLTALTDALAENAFKKVFQEVDWQVMKHRNGEVPRRVAAQGELGPQGSVPLYRHPADESPPLLEFTPTVRKIRDELQMLLRQPFNHCLIQLYRNGQDNISEHSDKTLDIVRGSSIINLSLGAQRTMTLRSKRDADALKREGAPVPRNIQRIPMPHNSCFVLGWRTNQRWLHGVRPDKRLLAEKSEEERAFGGQRISLTFRNIGTFTNRARTKIWGQGAKSKFEAAAGQIITSNNPEMEKMIHAFGMENQLMDFDWDAYYGAGFDVLNLAIADGPSTTTSLRLSSDEISNLRVKMGIFHRSIPCKFIPLRRPTPDQGVDQESITPARGLGQKRSIFSLSEAENPVFRDCDANFTEAHGDIAILVYLNRFYPLGPDPSITPREEHHIAQSTFGGLTSSNEILFLWQELRGIPLSGSTRASHRIRRFIAHDTGTADPATSEGLDLLAIFEEEMDVWEERAGESTYISGEIFHVTDCAIWPVLNEIIRRWEGWSERRYPNIAQYWRRVGALPLARKAMMEKGDDSVKEEPATASSSRAA